MKGHEGQSIVTVTENDTVQFICLFDRMASNAKLMFRWTTVLLEDEDTINLTNIIIHISCEDIGYYTCVGRNTYNFGQPSIEQLTLLVMCKLFFLKTKFNEFDDVLSVWKAWKYTLRNVHFILVKW